jgi:hypothetical protein
MSKKKVTFAVVRKKRPYVSAVERRVRKAAREAKHTEKALYKKMKKMCHIVTWDTPKGVVRYRKICPPRNTRNAAVKQYTRNFHPVPKSGLSQHFEL